IAGGATPVSPWFEQSLRLYRAFEFFEARSRMSSMGNVTVQGAVAVLAQNATTVPLASSGSLFNPVISNALASPSGITPGNGALWSIRPGMTLIIDNGLASEERVLVSGVTATSFTAYFQQNHTAPFNVAVPILGSRQPGKININTVWPDGTYPFIDPTTGQTVNVNFSLVFRALCDPQACNSFASPGLNSDLHVDQIFDNFRNLRPFGSYGLGFTAAGDPQWPTGIGINNTLLATNQVANPGADQTRLLEDVAGQALYGPTTHPYLRYELATKIFNNVTVRSNTFAVWCTVGF